MKSVVALAGSDKGLESGLANLAISSSPRLDFIDGLRGLAALYVVYYHIVKSFAGTLPPMLWRSLGFILHGHIAVDLFIVLLGYCLMLPLARSGATNVKGGFLVFMKRRSWRILPPYYAALLFSLVAYIFSTGTWRSLHGIHDAGWEEGYAPVNWLTHLLLIHNWFPKWSLGIDGAMWSVATEWQIYLLFPTLLLPIRQRFGWATAITAGIVVGVVACLIAGDPSRLNFFCPWYLGLFAMGMAAAIIGFSADNSSIGMRRVVPWKWLTAILSGAVWVMLLKGSDEFGWWMVCQDILAGALFASFLVWAGQFAMEERFRQPLIVRALEGRWVVLLGTFSYSFYLLHTPLLGKLRPILNALHLPQIGALIFLMCFTVPVTLLLSYLFHLVFERPFMRLGPSARQSRPVDKLQLVPSGHSVLAPTSSVI